MEGEIILDDTDLRQGRCIVRLQVRYFPSVSQRTTVLCFVLTLLQTLLSSPGWITDALQQELPIADN